MSFSPDSLTDASNVALAASLELAKENGNVGVYPVHIAAVLLDPGKDASSSPSMFSNIINRAGGDPLSVKRGIQKALVRLPSQDPPPADISFSHPSIQVLEDARKIQKSMKDDYIAVDHIILALIKDSTMVGLLKEAAVSAAAIQKEVEQARGNKRITSRTAEAGFDALAKYAIDMTKLAEEGKLDPVIGRDNEVRRMIRILCRRTKNNPVLIGEPGVGKTALVESLAQRIIKRDVPASLDARLFSLDMGSLMAGAKYKGEYEERVKSVLDEIEKNSENGIGIILFIDELHLIMAGKGDGEGGMDAANLLKPMLARGKLRCIGATTLAEYRRYIEKDAAFERRFAQVLVNEPSVQETISILRGISEKYEVHHGVRILDQALCQAASLAHRYLTSRRLPDSAIDLVDEACAAVRVARETAPEEVDALERQKIQLEVEVHALTREKDATSKERLQAAKKAIADVDEKLRPLRARYEVEHKGAEEIAKLRRRLDELKAKADDAERRHDIATTSDIRFYAIPNVQENINTLEAARAGNQTQIDTVTPEAIAEIVGRWTGIPVSRLLATEREKLMNMEKMLSESVVGQPEAVKAVANAIRLSRSGLSNENRPIASFLFAGPSGTGKTLMAKTLATILFDSPDAMIRIDSSEYTDKHTLSRLIGAPPGYVGYEEAGTLTEYVRRKPYSIVLSMIFFFYALSVADLVPLFTVDEIEKACREFVTLFLQVLDDGRLTDGHGRVVDFRNTVIIMTSNLGAMYLNALERAGAIPAATHSLVMDAIESHFPPEFRNRIDDIIIYRPLSRSNIRKIVDIRLREFEKRLEPRKLKLNLEEASKDYLGLIGYSTTYGARPLNRAMQDQILNPLAMMLLQEKVLDGEMVYVAFDKGRNRLVIVPNHRGIVGAESMEVDEDGEDEDFDDYIVEEVG
ncbi:heat shock protein [Cantharellus anzutake]|uniref:heat shock protein n=1 Tax=Cantharellus anzutake TaxID=1750568 RepID=UPI001904D8CC|nr:heat shock protein [Cantharellus anzutake]KAF8329777.1 heat shock protein [Cantharellus anzutake]